MVHKMETLGYSQDNLSPIMSKLTMDFHYGKHYNAYVTNLNKLIEGTEFADMPLNEIIVKSEGGIFNNAAQASNHGLFFTQLTPQGLQTKEGKLYEAIISTFGSFDELRIQMSKVAKTLFGSGWVWLASKDGKLEIKSGSNAYTPLVDGMKPLMAIDVWEHAYYLDYQNRRPDYVDAIWDILDWKVISKRFE
ncbi:MAG: superoxide dismutase [Bacteroidetes bacterium]|nr:superoxide dismutase [Bacteroidota bacterium]